MVDLRPRVQGLRAAELAANIASRRDELLNQLQRQNEGADRAGAERGDDNRGPEPQDNQGQVPPPPPARGGRTYGRADGRLGRAQGRARAAARGAQAPPPFVPPPPPVNEYVLMLQRMGFTQEAVTQLQDLGLNSLEDYWDISEKDIPAIMKELRRNNIFVRQTSQNYLQALRYWVMRNG